MRIAIVTGLTAALLTASGIAGAVTLKRGGPVPAMPKPRGLSSPTAPGSAQSRLLATPDGSVFMSWFEKKRGQSPDVAAPAGHVLHLAALRANRWTPALSVIEGDSFFVNWADFPAVCAFGEHGLAVAWMWKSGEETYAYQTRIMLSEDGGAHWTPPIVLHDDRDGSEHGFVSLLPQGAGVRAVWLDGHNLVKGVEEGMADMTLHSRFISPIGSLGIEQELDGRTCDCCPTAAVSVGEDILVAYRDRSPEEIRDISVVRLAGGKWEAPSPVHADGWKIPGCPVNGPALAVRGERVAIAWYTEAADTPRVQVAFSADGGRTFGAPTRVDEGKPLGRVGLALLDDGTAAVSWMEGESKEARLRARFVREGERPGTAATVARLPGARASGVPQLVRDRDRLVFSWTVPGTPTRVKLAAVTLPKR